MPFRVIGENLEVVAALIAALAAALGASRLFYLLADWLLQVIRGAFGISPPSDAPEETLERRVRTLTSSLSEATHLISQIEGEIASRQVLVETLRREVETYERLREVAKPEAEAVAAVLRAELATESRRTLKRDLIVNSIFFVLGAALSLVFAYALT